MYIYEMQVHWGTGLGRRGSRSKRRQAKRAAHKFWRASAHQYCTSAAGIEYAFIRRRRNLKLKTGSEICRTGFLDCGLRRRQRNRNIAKFSMRRKWKMDPDAAVLLRRVLHLARHKICKK